MLPTKYEPKYLAEVTKMAAANLTETEMIAKLGASRSTFYRWKKERPEFKEAIEIGEAMYGANMIQLGREGMLGISNVDYKFWKDLSKKVPELKDPERNGTTNNTQINIDNMNVLNEQSNEELLMYIKSQMEKHPELQNIIEGEIVSDT